MAEIKARGEPMTIAEIVPAYVPPEKNAAVELDKAFALVYCDKPNEQYIPGKHGGKLKPNVEAARDYFFKKSLNQVSAEETKKILELVDSPEFTGIFDALNAAALKPGCNYDLKYEDGIAMVLPNLSVFGTSIRLLCLKALAQANKGNMTGACDTLMTAIKLSHHLQNDPVLVFQLVRIAGLQLTAETLNNIADNFQIPEENAKNFIADLEKINTTEPLKKSLIAERVVWGFTIFDGFISGKHGYDYFHPITTESSRSPSRLQYFIGKLFIKKDYNEYLKIMSLYSKVCDRPYYLSKESELKGIETETGRIPRYYVLSRLLTPNFTGIFRNIAEFQTKLAISKIKLALVIYKGKHAVFPENLEQLKPDILREIPIDELTGTPLTYKREGEKYVLLSATVQKFEEERKLEREKAEHAREEQRKKDLKK